MIPVGYDLTVGVKQANDLGRVSLRAAIVVALAEK
jgi:hypothetical protein